MHSKGGRGLVAETVSPAVGESRRGGNSAALVHRRSFGGTGVIAGTTGEKLRVISAIGFSALVIRLRRSPIVADSPLSRSAARHFTSGHKTSYEYEHDKAMRRVSKIGGPRQWFRCAPTQPRRDDKSRPSQTNDRARKTHGWNG